MHRSVGLFVTRQVRLQAEQVQEKFRHPILRPVLDFASLWFQEQAWLTFHEPLAAAILFEPAVYGFASGVVKVITDPENGPLGLTWFHPNTEYAKYRVATHVTAGRFIEAFFKGIDS